MNNFIKTISIFLFSAILFTGCNQLSTEELLTQATWDYQSFANPDLDEDTLELFQAILSLGNWTFSTDGSYTITYDDNTFDDNNGTWTLNSDETELTLTEDGDAEVYTIQSIDEGSLVLQYTDSTGTNTLSLRTN